MGNVHAALGGICRSRWPCRLCFSTFIGAWPPGVIRSSGSWKKRIPSATLQGQMVWRSQITPSSETELTLLILLLGFLRVNSHLACLQPRLSIRRGGKAEEAPAPKAWIAEVALDGNEGFGLRVVNGGSR